MEEVGEIRVEEAMRDAWGAQACRRIFPQPSVSRQISTKPTASNAGSAGAEVKRYIAVRLEPSPSAGSNCMEKQREVVVRPGPGVVDTHSLVPIRYSR